MPKPRELTQNAGVYQKPRELTHNAGVYQRGV